MRAIIADLHAQSNATGQGALGLLLEVISEQAAQSSGLRQHLEALARELRALGY